jgi:hypothetical protein
VPFTPEIWAFLVASVGVTFLLAWHMPKSLAYWVFIRMAGAGEAHWSVMDVLEMHKDWYSR